MSNLGATQEDEVCAREAGQRPLMIRSTLSTASNGTPHESRVVFAAPCGLSIGGVTTWTLEMCRRLPSRGHRGIVIEHEPQKVKPFGPSFRAEAQVVSCSSAFSFTTASQNLAAYTSVLPAVFVPNWSDGTYAICARLSRTHAEKMRVLGVCHTCHPFYFKTLTFYEPLIHRFLAVSEECARELRKRLPARTKDILVRPYAVDRCRHLDRVYTGPGRPLQLLYAGRIVEKQKRVLNLLPLAEALHQRRVDFRLRIIGAGPDKKRLGQAIHRLPPDLRPRISLENEMPPARILTELCATDICLLVSEYEGTSLFMLEGMARGCVPVVTRVSGTAGVIDHEHNGFTVPVGKVQEMAQVIQKLDRDRSLLQRLGTNAHAKLGHYEYGPYLTWFDGLIQELWAERPRAWPAWRTWLPPSTITRGIVRSGIRSGRSLAGKIPGVKPSWSWFCSRFR